MKREFIKSLITEITDDQLNQIMAENGKDIEAVKTTLTTKEQELTSKATEADTLKTQLAERDKDIATLKTQAGNSEELNKKITELQGKYDADTKDAAAKLEASAAALAQQQYDFAAEKFFAPVVFTSESAKKAAIADFKAKGLKLDNGEFLGGKDFVEEMKKADPGAFKQDETEPGKDPQFAKGSNGAGDKGKGAFDMGAFTFVRQPPKEK